MTSIEKNEENWLKLFITLKAFVTSGNHCQRRWRLIRDSYVRFKRDQGTPVGVSYTKKEKNPLMDNLNFLDAFVKHRRLLWILNLIFPPAYWTNIYCSASKPKWSWMRRTAPPSVTKASVRNTWALRSQWAVTTTTTRLDQVVLTILPSLETVCLLFANLNISFPVVSQKGMM